MACVLNEAGLELWQALALAWLDVRADESRARARNVQRSCQAHHFRGLGWGRERATSKRAWDESDLGRGRISSFRRTEHARERDAAKKRPSRRSRKKTRAEQVFKSRYLRLTSLQGGKIGTQRASKLYVSRWSGGGSTPLVLSLCVFDSYRVRNPHAVREGV